MTTTEPEIRAKRSFQSMELRKILVPVDFSPASDNAVKYAEHLGGASGADLIFLHVMVPDAPIECDDLSPNCADELKDAPEENLRALVRMVRNQGNGNATSVTRSGLPTHEIIEEAKASGVDLIIVGSHGYTGWKHFCIGSTAERVVRAAPCSVLVVREKEHEFV